MVACTRRGPRAEEGNVESRDVQRRESTRDGRGRAPWGRQLQGSTGCGAALQLPVGDGNPTKGREWVITRPYGVRKEGCC